MMAAALVVVEAELRDWWAGRLVDLRVDRSDAPLAELRRLLDASEAYAGFSRAVGALFSGDAAAAVASADEGLSMLPGEENLRFVRAGALPASGDTGSAAAELRGLVAAPAIMGNHHPQLRRQGPDHAAAARPGGAAGVTGRGRQASPAGKTGSASATWPARTRVPWAPTKRNRRPPRRRNGLARRHHPARPHPHARRPGRAGPAPPRRTRPGSPYRPLPQICDGEPQMPVPGRLVSHAGGRGSHRHPGPIWCRTLPVTPVTVASAWSLRITCASAATDRDEQFVTS
jgi:hypothetical protein